MGSRYFASSILAALTVVASASAVRAEKIRPRGIYVAPDRSKPLAPAQTIEPGLVMYFNKNGGTYTRGQNDSRTNKSSIPLSSATITPWTCSDAVWQQFMVCIRDMYAPYNVVITDQDPGQTPHIETVVAGKPQQLATQQYPGGLPCSASTGCVGGIAPLGCGGGVDNAVTFVFADIYQCDAQAICETAAQESAHAFGFDHQAYCPDPMTYDQGCGKKKFRDYDANCGEYEGDARQCQCTGDDTQNSHQELVKLFGLKPTNQPPAVSFTSPASGASVAPAFAINVTASDDNAVSKVGVYVDGQLLGEKALPPYTWTAPALADGSHQLQARAYDADGATATASVTVNLVNPVDPGGCDGNADCVSGQVCVNNVCVDDPGPVDPPGDGQLGEPCTDGEDCLSGECGSGPGGDKCTQVCDPDADDCPAGFECLPAGGAGACWPGDGGGGDSVDPVDPQESPNTLTGGCGCRTGGPTSLASLLGALALALLFVPFARRR